MNKNSNLKYLNLGCGINFHSDWINVDMAPRDSSVLEFNFLNGIPFQDNSFDVVYHSHVIEHFSKKTVSFFISECFRILRPGGVIRIVTPDLERIVTEYLQNLKGALNDISDLEQNYDWILLEMYDQTVREKSGGEMLEYINSNCLNSLYVSSRIGDISKNNSHLNTKDLIINLQKRKGPSIIKRIINKLKTLIVGIVLNKEDRQALQVGKFRASGEIHQWMYDRFSLGRLLKKSGFNEVAVRNASESYIKDWSKFKLDNERENASLYMEARKE